MESSLVKAPPSTPSLGIAVRNLLAPRTTTPLFETEQRFGILPTAAFWSDYHNRWLAFPLTFPMMMLFVAGLVATGGLAYPLVSAVLCAAFGQLSYGLVERRLRELVRERPDSAR